MMRQSKGIRTKQEDMWMLHRKLCEDNTASENQSWKIPLSVNLTDSGDRPRAA
jgi:hypothetical protein